MPETLWIDYSFARPDPSGFAGVMRYLNTSPSGTKGLSLAEVADLQARKLPIGIIWETTASAALGGAPVARDHVVRANAEADRLGVPRKIPIFYCIDFEAQPAQVETYVRELRAQTGGRPVGIYGSYFITTWARKIGVGWTWQTLGWSKGNIDADANIYQREFYRTSGYDVSLERNWFPAWGRSVSPATMDVTRKIQSALRLKVDGVLGQSTYDAVWRLSAASRDGRAGFIRLSPEWRVALQKNIGATRTDGVWTLTRSEMPKRLRDAVGGVQVALRIPIDRVWDKKEGDAFKRHYTAAEFTPKK